VRPFAEKYVTLAKEGDLIARRKAHAFIYEDLMVQKLFYELAERHHPC
jgi:large subunit ribosomal protein L17